MSNHFKIEKNLDLLSILRFESSSRVIARQLGGSHVAIYNRIKRLKANGYITEQVRSNIVTYSLTQLGNLALGSFENQNVNTSAQKVNTQDRTGAQKVNTPEKFSDIQRLHATRFRITNKVHRQARLPELIIDIKDHPMKVRKPNGWDQLIIEGFNDFFVAVNTYYTEIRGIVVKGDIETPTDELKFRAYQKFGPEIDHIEQIIARRIPGFKFLRDERGIVVMEFPWKEYAHEGDAAAQYHYKKKDRWIYFDPVTKRSRWGIDDSPKEAGIHDLEALDGETSSRDNESLRELKLDLGPDEWKSLASDVSREELGSMLSDNSDGKWKHREEKSKLAAAISLIYELAKRDSQTDDRFDRILTALERIAFPGGYSP